jgi:hypothetical protein
MSRPFNILKNSLKIFNLIEKVIEDEIDYIIVIVIGVFFNDPIVIEI